MNIRATAALILTDVISEHKSFQKRLLQEKKILDKLDKRDASFLQALCYGSLRVYSRLNFIVNELVKRKLPEKEKVLHYLLCLGIYQLSETDIAEHAALSETVAACEVLKKPWAKGFVNGVLRNFQRNRDAIMQKQNREAYYAQPLWFIERVERAWSEYSDFILKANLQHPPLSLRVNQTQIDRAAYLTLLQENGINADIIPETKCGIILKTPLDVVGLPGYSEGYFSVQDGAAQFVPALLELSPNLYILDACAAPGGKTTHILEEEPTSKILALDTDPTRLIWLRENLTRLKLNTDHVKIELQDAVNVAIAANAANVANVAKQANHGSQSSSSQFDRILLDAPCSSTGVIRRHPDILYMRRPSDFLQYHQTQLKLLKANWPLLKPKGLLLYSTCSIFSEENETVIEAFLKSTPDATIKPIKGLTVGVTKTYGHQILPGQSNMDGFYYARLQKE